MRCIILQSGRRCPDIGPCVLDAFSDGGEDFQVLGWSTEQIDVYKTLDVCIPGDFVGDAYWDQFV